MANTKILLWDFNFYQKDFHLRSPEEEDFETTLDNAEEGFQEYVVFIK